MLDYNLTITEQKFNALQGKELKSNLKKMLDAMSGMNKKQWQYAIALNNIVANEYYKPDFPNAKEFATALKLDPGTITKYTSAVRVMVNTLTPTYGYTMETLTYSKCAVLGSIKDVEKFLNDTGIDLVKATVREIEQAKREWNKPAQTVNAETKSANTEQPEQKQEQADELPTTTARYDNENVWFSIGNSKYVIPFTELKHYKVKA